MAKSTGDMSTGRGRSTRRVAGGAGDLADIDAEMGIGGGSTNRASAGIAPGGRAPRGLGGEYADRRAIASRIDTLQDRISNLQSSVNQSRGQNRATWADSRNRSLLPVLRRTLSGAVSVANGPGDWSFKRELVNDLLTTVQGA